MNKEFGTRIMNFLASKIWNFEPGTWNFEPGILNAIKQELKIVSFMSMLEQGSAPGICNLQLPNYILYQNASYVTISLRKVSISRLKFIFV